MSGAPRRARSVIALGLALGSATLGNALAPSALGAQAPADSAPPPEIAPRADSVDTPGLGGPSPTGALIRSFVVPGWGQFHVGAPVRGFVYLTVHGANAYMVVKTVNRVKDTRDEQAVAEEAARDSIEQVALADTMLQRVLGENPDTLEVLVAADPAVRRLDRLESARRQQRQDWVAWAGFWILASGLDAFVAAHLADFPAEVDVEPVRRDGRTGMQVGVRVPLGRRR